MAPGALGLGAYRALTRHRGAARPGPVPPDRPTGEVVWIHAGEPGNLPAVLDLAARLQSARSPLGVVVTLPEDPLPTGLPLPADVYVVSAPADHPRHVAAFLDHWRPGAGIWIWGGLRPDLLLAATAAGIALFLIDADAPGFDARRDRWLPDLTRRLLGGFAVVLTRSDAALTRLTRLGLPRGRGHVATPLLAGGQALPCVDQDLRDLAETLGGRPVWFAVRVSPEEVPIVLRAHRQALRLSHRLLLILTPADPAQTDGIARLAQERGQVSVDWSTGTFPEDGTQVMLAPDAGERGLFYRVAPVSFLGSSLVAGRGGCDPFEAAALGSAVLYGPKVGDYLAAYTRLATGGAARIVNDAAALGNAVTRLIAPDQAAAMAHAGWDVVSQGAALTDRVVDLVQEALDQRARQS